jgi:hypothetical protein
VWYTDIVPSVRALSYCHIELDGDLVLVASEIRDSIRTHENVAKASTTTIPARRGA